MKIKNTVINWTQYSKEIEKACQKHRELINTKFMQFLAGNNPNYGDEWIYVFWVNPHSQKLEQSDVGNIEEAQKLIDFYKFSKNNTKIVIRATGEDVSNQITFN